MTGLPSFLIKFLFFFCRGFNYSSDNNTPNDFRRDATSSVASGKTVQYYFHTMILCDIYWIHRKVIY